MWVVLLSVVVGTSRFSRDAYLRDALCKIPFGVLYFLISVTTQIINDPLGISAIIPNSSNPGHRPLPLLSWRLIRCGMSELRHTTG